MPLLDQLADAVVAFLDHGGEGLLAGAFTYGVLRARDAREQGVTNDRLASELNEDLRRWVRDRDRELEVEHNLIAARYNNPDSMPEWRERVPEKLRDLPAGSQYYSGAHVVAHAKAQRDELHQYRDEATLKLRTFHAQLERETRLHRF